MDQDGPSRSSTIWISSYLMSRECAEYTAEITRASSLEIEGSWPPIHFRFRYDNVHDAPTSTEDLQRRALAFWELRGSLGAGYVARLGERIRRIQYSEELGPLSHG